MNSKTFWPTVEIVPEPEKSVAKFASGFYAIFTSKSFFLSEDYYMLVSVDIWLKEGESLSLYIRFQNQQINDLIKLFRDIIPLKICRSGDSVWFMDAETAADLLPRFIEPTVPFILGQNIPDEVLVKLGLV